MRHVASRQNQICLILGALTRVDEKRSSSNMHIMAKCGRVDARQRDAFGVNGALDHATEILR